PAAGETGHHDGDPAVVDRRPAVLRPDLGDDQGRPRLHLRRDRVGDLQAVPGGLLRTVHRRQRCAVHRGRADRRTDEHLLQPAGGGPMRRQRTREFVVGLISLAAALVVFLVPFAFILLTAAKNPREAAEFSMSLPTTWQLWQNVIEVLTTREFVVLRAFINSTTLTVFSVLLMVVFAAMAGYVLQRRSSRWNGFINFMVLAGLI